MKRFVLSCLLTGLAALPATAALQAGAAAPDFQAQASLAGKAFPFHLKEALRKGPVVVYFYPAAYTGGCNIQAHAFAVDSDKFAAAGATIIGVSLDSIERLNDFSADPQYCAGKFPTAADPDGRIARSYDLAVRQAQPGKKDTRGIGIEHGFAERTTFIVSSDGKIVATVGGLAPAANVEKTLELVEHLSGR
jgi:peroxiredoxin